MPKIGIIVGSTRPGRKADAVARWVHDAAVQRGDAEYALVDIADYGLPLLDEPLPPMTGRYTKSHTRAWADTVGALDGFVFVTPEYNHSTSAALKNAIDFLYAEWGNKAAGFVSYGATGGTRAVEHLRLVMAELQVADVRAQVSLSLRTDFTGYKELTPHPAQQQVLSEVLDQVVAWSTVLKPLRTPNVVDSVDHTMGARS
jgi:NAD(P)H-dependent FMN reductase